MNAPSTDTHGESPRNGPGPVRTHHNHFAPGSSSHQLVHSDTSEDSVMLSENTPSGCAVGERLPWTKLFEPKIPHTQVIRKTIVTCLLCKRHGENRDMSRVKFSSHCKEEHQNVVWCSFCRQFYEAGSHPSPGQSEIARITHFKRWHRDALVCPFADDCTSFIATNNGNFVPVAEHGKDAHSELPGSVFNEKFQRLKDTKLRARPTVESDGRFDKASLTEEPPLELSLPCGHAHHHWTRDWLSYAIKHPECGEPYLPE